jgi:ABC-type nitrate/sulfonate/bicarbonate transport system substrate-binding protein
MRPASLAVAALLVPLVGCSSSAVEPTSAPTHIAISYSSTGPTMMPVEVAKRTGGYAQNGLDPEFILGPNGIPALIAGEVQFAFTSTEDMASADLAGADLVIVGTMLPYIGQDFIVRPEITTMADLQGKPIGITRRGTVTETVARMAARDGGLDPDRDMVLSELGTSDKEVVALQAGAVAGASLSRPNSDIAVGQGAHVLFNYTSQKIPYAASDIIVVRQWGKQHPETVLAVLKSVAGAVQFIHAHPDEASKMYQDWASVDEGNAKLAVELAANYVPEKMPPTAEGIKAALSNLAERLPAAASADPSSFMDDSYIKQLDAQGFYAQLDQPKP